MCPYLAWPLTLQLQLDPAQWGRWGLAELGGLCNQSDACIIPKLKVWSRFNSRTPNPELTVLVFTIQVKVTDCRQQSLFLLENPPGLSDRTEARSPIPSALPSPCASKHSPSPSDSQSGALIRQGCLHDANIVSSSSQRTILSAHCDTHSARCTTVRRACKTALSELAPAAQLIMRGSETASFGSPLRS